MTLKPKCFEIGQKQCPERPVSANYSRQLDVLSFRCAVFMAQFPGEVVKHAQLIAVQVGNSELAQVPRFILWLREDLRPGLAPTMIQFIDFVLTIQIQPDHDLVPVSVVSAERRIRQEHAAVALRYAADAAFVIAPVEMEPERVYVILGGLFDIANRNLWNRLGKVHALAYASLDRLGMQTRLVSLCNMTSWQDNSNCWFICR